MKRIGILAVAAMTTFGIGCNTERRANTGDAVGTSGSADVSRGDKDFVNDIAIANMAEIELGKMAAQRASNADVKKFGQMMVSDHTEAGSTLKPLATNHRIEMPAAMDDDHRDLQERLGKLQGAEFDREYIKAMVDGHQDVLDKLESRIDKERLADYKSKYSAPGAGRTTDERIKVEALTPEKSDDRVTMSLNEWAAKTYPVVFTHLQRAKELDEAIRKTTN